MLLSDKENNLKCKCGYNNTISDEHKEQYICSYEKYDDKRKYDLSKSYSANCKSLEEWTSLWD
jgi:hypothetical protein